MGKNSLDFLMLDIAIDRPKLQILKNFGAKGFGIYALVLRQLYGIEGYYLKWSDVVNEEFCELIKTRPSSVAELIYGLVRYGIFDKTLFDRYRILTSESIQEMYMYAAIRREKQVDYIKEYLLVDPTLFAKKAAKSGKFKKNQLSTDTTKGKASLVLYGEDEIRCREVIEKRIKDKIEYDILIAEPDPWPALTREFVNLYVRACAEDRELTLGGAKLTGSDFISALTELDRDAFHAAIRSLNKDGARDRYYYLLGVINNMITQSRMV